ncbi:Hypothetical predicted protein [Octopus vulgaris]|uniref:Uncharacterized protein n=1 Tax=Octopus vulgaris TaxID=6645 RepID=A0AA36FGT7_OCTVU|nr:Hypothetical predicted protein [Octopus vulgaris]
MENVGEETHILAAFQIYSEYFLVASSEKNKSFRDFKDQQFQISALIKYDAQTMNISYRNIVSISTTLV